MKLAHLAGRIQTLSNRPILPGEQTSVSCVRVRELLLTSSVKSTMPTGSKDGERRGDEMPASQLTERDAGRVHGHWEREEQREAGGGERTRKIIKGK